MVVSLLGRKSKYPFRGMQEGDFISFPCKTMKEAKLAQIAAHVAGRDMGCKFITKYMPHGYLHVWRSQVAVDTSNRYVAMQRGSDWDMSIPFVQEKKIAKWIRDQKQLVKEANKAMGYKYDVRTVVENGITTLRVWRIE